LDRRRAFAAFLIGLATLGASPPRLPLAEAEWIAPERRLEALTTQPRACALPPAGSDALASYTIGRVVFHTPTLLGGQAARAGLSCASCHANGRGNPDFAFSGLSGAAGTADVTSSIMSKSRGDGVANPVRIPDLARDPPKISRAADDAALAQFIRGLVVEEFDGAEPPTAVLEGLATYVRAQSATFCTSDARVPRRMLDDLSIVADASEAAIRLALQEDQASMRLTIGAARNALGRVSERLQLADAQKQLGKLDKQLLRLQNGRASAGTAAKIRRWQADFAAQSAALRKMEGQSLYDRRVLEAALQR
jgi:hypothetical protein